MAAELLTPLKAGIRVGDGLVVRSFAEGELGLGDRIGSTLLIGLPGIPALVAAIYFFPTTWGGRGLFVVPLLGIGYGILGICLLFIRLGLTYTFSRNPRRLMRMRWFLPPKEIPLGAVTAVRVAFEEDPVENDRDMCYLSLIDDGGAVQLRLDSLNPARADVGVLLSTAAAIADILDLPARVTGEPCHLAVAEANRITSQLACFEAFLQGELDIGGLVPERETQPSRGNEILHWIWDNFAKLFLVVLLGANLAIVWRLLPLAGMSIETRHDFSILIILLLVGVSVAEREALNYFFGWYRADLRMRGVAGYPFLSAVWVCLLVLALMLGVQGKNERQAAGQREAQQEAARKDNPLNDPKVQEGIRALERIEKQRNAAGKK